MKVGVYFFGYQPEKGGGHAFEREILLSLCELVQESRHELVLGEQSAELIELLLRG